MLRVACSDLAYWSATSWASGLYAHFRQCGSSSWFLPRPGTCICARHWKVSRSHPRLPNWSYRLTTPFNWLTNSRIANRFLSTRILCSHYEYFRFGRRFRVVFSFGVLVAPQRARYKHLRIDLLLKYYLINSLEVSPLYPGPCLGKLRFSDFLFSLWLEPFKYYISNAWTLIEIKIWSKIKLFDAYKIII